MFKKTLKDFICWSSSIITLLFLPIFALCLLCLSRYVWHLIRKEIWWNVSPKYLSLSSLNRVTSFLAVTDEADQVFSCVLIPLSLLSFSHKQTDAVSNFLRVASLSPFFTSCLSWVSWEGARENERRGIHLISLSASFPKAQFPQQHRSLPTPSLVPLPAKFPLSLFYNICKQKSCLQLLSRLSFCVFLSLSLSSTLRVTEASGIRFCLKKGILNQERNFHRGNFYSFLSAEIAL